jgi:N-acetylneuraminic acid mutarotase
MVGGKIYVMGGRSVDWPAPLEKTVEMYDPDLDEWTFVADMNTARAVLSTEVLDGKIYAMGGVSTPINDLQSVEVYFPQTNTWTLLDDMPGTRGLHGSAVVNDKILVFGGVSGGVLWPGTWEFDPQDSTWSEKEGADMPEEIIWFADAVVEFSPETTCIYTFGGGYASFFDYPNLPPPFVTDAVLKYCPLTTSPKNPENTLAPDVLFQNYPNPFDSHTMIKYELKNSGKVILKIFNLAGQLVTTPVDGIQLAGEHEIEWKAEGLPGGVYFYLLQTEEFSETRRLILKN